MQVIHERVPVKHLAAVEAAVADVCTQHVVGWTMDEVCDGVWDCAALICGHTHYHHHHHLIPHIPCTQLQATDEWAQLVITVDEIRAAQSTLLAGVEDGSQREGGRGGPRKRAASKLPVVLDDDTSDTETSEEEEEDDDGSSEDEQEEVCVSGGCGSEYQFNMHTFKPPTGDANCGAAAKTATHTCIKGCGRGG